MWCNPWIIKEVFRVSFKIIMIGGAFYWGMYAFAKISWKLNKKK